MSGTTTLTASDKRDLTAALRALDRIADRHGNDWEEYEWDDISSARSLIRERLGQDKARA